MLQLSKALQLVANKIDPPEHSPLYCIRESLRTMHVMVDNLMNKLCRGLAIVCVTDSLLKPAADLYASMCAKIDDIEFMVLQTELGPAPPANSEERDLNEIPSIRRIRSLLFSSGYLTDDIE